MSQFIVHDKTKADLDAIVASPRASYMLVGGRWSGKRQSALYVAKMLHCGAQADCVGCRRIEAGTDPDVLRLTPNEKGSITIEMAHNLVDSLSKKSHRADANRVVIIESAEAMTIAAQNALLKVIEEPPAKTIFLLLIKNVQGLLATIKSRSQLIYMRPIKSDELIRGRAGLAMELVNSPEQKDIQLYIQTRAEEIMSASTFDRIVLVDKLAADKDRNEIIDWVSHLVREAARNQNPTSQSLQSMQNYFIDTSAGVAGKHALTEMMIRL
jgi:DNA polymerase III gamma/tau subunit